MMRVVWLLILALAGVQIAHGGMYGEHVTHLSSSNFDKEVVNSAETWLVKFYAPWCGHCKSSAPAFSKAAKKLEGVARLGVVNCDEEQSLAQRFGVQGFPSIKVFKGEGRRARRPSDYEGARSAKAFAEHARYVMPSFVARVKPSGADAFFSDLRRLPHVLLFTDKSSTSPLYKGMSARFKKSIAFGEVRANDGLDLAKQYSVTKFPTLLTFQAGKKDAKDSHLYKGSMDPKSLISYFGGVVKGNFDGTENSESGDSNTESGDGAQQPEQEKKVFSQPKAYSGEVEGVTSAQSYKAKCGSRKDGRMCGLAFLPGGSKHKSFSEIPAVAQQYLYDNLAFAVIDSATEGGKSYAQAFGVADHSTAFVAVRARKNKYAKMAEDAPFGKESLTSFLDRVIGGDVSYSKLKGDLPAWAEDIPTDGKGENADSSNATTADEGQCGTEKPKDGGKCGAEGKSAKDEL